MLIEFIQPDFEFADERGSLKQLVHQGWNQVNYITSAAGAFRGNHYHKYNTEAFYVISGSFKLIAENIVSGESEEFIMKAGDFFKIGPNINHSFDYFNETALISFYDKGVEDENGGKDIWSL